MSWVRLDDGFADHPKVMALGDDRLACLGVHVAALCYCARHLTDGFVPETFALGFPSHLVKALVYAGLWEVEDGAFVIHDYLVYNPSREQVRSDREASRVRMKFARTSPEVHLPPPLPLPVRSTSHEVLLDARGKWPEGADAIADAWFLVGRRRLPTAGEHGQMGLIRGYLETFDQDGDKRGADLILRHPDDPIGALKADRNAFLGERIEAAKVAERKPDPPKRRGGGLTGVNAELAAILATQYAGEAKP